MTKLFSYKMTTDSGFAPNPYGKTLTLATCKPYIRKASTKKKGVWIAGWTSQELMDRLGNGQRVLVGKEKLIFLMQIDRKLTFEQYFDDSDFQDKKPIGNNNKQGDNVYYKDDKGDWQRLHNENHCDGMSQDLFGEYVLIAGEFYYFGDDPLDVPKNVRPAIPESQHPHGNATHNESIANAFIGFVKQSYSGKIGTPHGR